jgi:hypothetical protein
MGDTPDWVSILCIFGLSSAIRSLHWCRPSIVSLGTVPNLTCDSFQEAYRWPSRVHPKQKSAALTTRMGHVVSPIYLCFLVTTAS